MLNSHATSPRHYFVLVAGNLEPLSTFLEPNNGDIGQPNLISWGEDIRHSKIRAQLLLQRAFAGQGRNDQWITTASREFVVPLCWSLELLNATVFRLLMIRKNNFRLVLHSSKLQIKSRNLEVYSVVSTTV